MLIEMKWVPNFLIQNKRLAVRNTQSNRGTGNEKRDGSSAFSLAPRFTGRLEIEVWGYRNSVI